MWPWQNPEFWTGFRAAMVAAVVLVVLVLVRSARLVRLPSPLPIGGLVLTLAGLWSVEHTWPLTDGLLVGLAGLGVAAGLAYIREVPTWATLFVATPFGWLIGYHGGVPGAPWVRVAVALAAAAGGMLAATTDHRWRSQAIGLPMIAITVVGIYATAPDTEETLALLPIVALLAVLGWPLRLLTLGRAGAGASVGLVVWVAAIDGRGRPSSIVGGLACLGLLAALPVAGLLVRGRTTRTLSPALAAPVLLAVHFVVVGLSSRVAGLRRDLPTAVMISVTVGIAALAASALLYPIRTGGHGPTATGSPQPVQRGRQAS